MRKEAKEKAHKSYRNITVDSDIQTLLIERGKKLENVLGFTPTMSQTLRYLIKLSKEQK